MLLYNCATSSYILNLPKIQLVTNLESSGTANPSLPYYIAVIPASPLLGFDMGQQSILNPTPPQKSYPLGLKLLKLHMGHFMIFKSSHPPQYSD